MNNETMISSIHSGMCCKKTTIEILLCILFSLIRFSFFFFYQLKFEIANFYYEFLILINLNI